MVLIFVGMWASANHRVEGLMLPYLTFLLLSQYSLSKCRCRTQCFMLRMCSVCVVFLFIVDLW